MHAEAVHARITRRRQQRTERLKRRAAKKAERRYARKQAEVHELDVALNNPSLRRVLISHARKVTGRAQRRLEKWGGLTRAHRLAWQSANPKV